LKRKVEPKHDLKRNEKAKGKWPSWFKNPLLTLQLP